MMNHYIVVCGMQRSGTRQYADYLNATRRACIQFEVHAKLLREASNLVASADSALRKGVGKQAFAEKRFEFVCRLVAFLSNQNVVEGPPGSIQGFKTPRIEALHDSLMQMFFPSVEMLHYFLCIRNPEDCYLSLNAMPWFKVTAEQFLDRFTQCLDDAISIRRESEDSDSKCSIHPLVLDEYLASVDRTQWLQKNLFCPAQLLIPDEEATSIISSTRNRNATLAITGSERPSSLCPASREYFDGKRESIEERISTFNDLFGTQLRFST